jgi:hypothetical protein
MRILVFLVLLSAMFFSCKKGQGEFLLTGTLTDNTFNTALNNATVKLYKVPAGSTQEILIGTQTTGSEGKYSFEFTRDKTEKYILKVTKSNYFDLNETIFFSSLDLKEENIRNYSTTAKGWIEIRIVNQNGQSSDQFHFIKQQGKAGCSECCPTIEQDLYGAVDTSIFCVNDGNTVYSILYYGTGISSTINGVNTAAFDTTTLLINY